MKHELEMYEGEYSGRIEGVSGLEYSERGNTAQEKKGMSKYNVYMTNGLYEAVKAYAEGQEMSFSSLTRKVLKGELKRRGIEYQERDENEIPVQGEASNRNNRKAADVGESSKGESDTMRVLSNLATYSHEYSQALLQFEELMKYGFIKKATEKEFRNLIKLVAKTEQDVLT